MDRNEVEKDGILFISHTNIQIMIEYVLSSIECFFLLLMERRNELGERELKNNSDCSNFISFYIDLLEEKNFLLYIHCVCVQFDQSRLVCRLLNL